MGGFVRFVVAISAVLANPCMSGVPPTVLSERSIASSSYDQAEEQKYRDKIQSEIESLKKEILRLQSRVAALGG